MTEAARQVLQSLPGQVMSGRPVSNGLGGWEVSLLFNFEPDQAIAPDSPTLLALGLLYASAGQEWESLRGLVPMAGKMAPEWFSKARKEVDAIPAEAWFHCVLSPESNIPHAQARFGGRGDSVLAAMSERIERIGPVASDLMYREGNRNPAAMVRVYNFDVPKGSALPAPFTEGYTVTVHEWGAWSQSDPDLLCYACNGAGWKLCPLSEVPEGFDPVLRVVRASRRGKGGRFSEVSDPVQGVTLSHALEVFEQ